MTFEHIALWVCSLMVLGAIGLLMWARALLDDVLERQRITSALAVYVESLLRQIERAQAGTKAAEGDD